MIDASCMSMHCTCVSQSYPQGGLFLSDAIKSNTVDFSFHTFAKQWSSKTSVLDKNLLM